VCYRLHKDSLDTKLKFDKEDPKDYRAAALSSALGARLIVLPKGLENSLPF
jgi:hypothetical protein